LKEKIMIITSRQYDLVQKRQGVLACAQVNLNAANAAATIATEALQDVVAQILFDGGTDAKSVINGFTIKRNGAEYELVPQIELVELPRPAKQ
jgi:uncharacterized protein YgbK (DUF1537 family)